ncbi:MAG: autotransporter outer membrane beta-barrel domain-containing protein, partial [Pseudomonadales bacterium]
GAPFTLDLTEQQLAAALQQVAPEEVITQGTMAVETSNGQITNIGARLAALHRGAGGFSASGLSFIAGGETLEPAVLGATMLADGARGGGAAADEGFSKLGGFINGTISSGEKDITTLEDGFDVDALGITAGVDYRFSDKFVFGGALGLTNLDADIDTFGSSTNPVVNGGEVESDGFTLSGYGTYFISDKYYIDGIISLGSNDYDITRRIFYTPGPGVPGSCTTCGVVDGTATSDTDSDQVALSIGGGYQGGSGAATWGTFARLDYLKVEIDSFTEAGAGGLNLFVDDQEVKSLVSVIGTQASVAISRGFGVVVPQGRFSWHHEFENDSRSIVTKYANDPFDTFFISTTDDPDEDFFVIGLGVSAVFKGGTQAFIFLESVLELEDVTNNVITIGGRREF